MSFLANRPIIVRIIVIAMIPFLAATALALGSLNQSWSAYRTSEAVEQRIATAQEIGGLVHELQKERGMSAGFTASEGRKFSDALPAQRERTDRMMTRLRSHAVGDSQVNAALDLFHDITLMRDRVNAREAAVPEIARFYTAGITQLLEAMTPGSDMETRPEVLAALDAYTSLSYAKEKAGLERAMGATGFGAGRFAPEIYDNFVGLRAEQDVYLDRFRIHASTAAKGRLATIMAEEDAQAVFAMRQLASMAGAPGSSTVDAEVWWDRITGKIDALKSVEDAVGLELAGLAQADRARAETALLSEALLVALIGFIALAATVIVSRSISNPLQSLETATHRLSSGDYDADIDVAETRDEVGRLAASIRSFRDQLRDAEAARMAHAREREENLRLVETRSRKVDDLTGRFDADMAGALTVFADSVDTLLASAAELDTRASEASERSMRVASASQQTNTNVQIVASATEELSLSIEEIVTQVSRGSQSMADATEQARIANTDMKSLDQAAREIDAVVKLIADIAEQTNVLALNATIEASRAGSEGAGFAVVATEVRALAEQTAQATRQIAATVAEVVDKSDRAARGMDRIAQMLHDVEQTGTAMSAALEQQGAAARNIAQSVQEAASGVEQVDANIVEIERSSASARDQVQTVIGAARLFSDRANTVRGSVGDFLSSIKAA